MKLLKLVLLMLTPSLCWAAYFKNPIDEAKLENALLAHVKTLNRPVSTFHWESEKSEFASKFTTSSSKGEREYIEAQMAGYLNTRGRHGFYLAADPAVSKRFRGWGDWRLIQVDLPATFSYLDIRDHELHRKLASILGSNRCADTFTEQGRKIGSPDECDELKQKMFRKINVNGLRYNWESPVLPSGSGCVGDDSSAFVVLNSNWLKPGMYKMFTSSSTGDRERRMLIQDMIRNTPRFYIFSGDVLWPDLLTKAEISQSTKSWMRKNILNCQDKPTKAEVYRDLQPDTSMESGEATAQ